MAEMVKNQDKRSGQCIVWLCWSDTAVTSLTHFMPPLDLNLIQFRSSFRTTSLAQMEFPIYTYVISSPTEVFKPQSSHDDPQHQATESAMEKVDLPLKEIYSGQKESGLHTDRNTLI